MYSPVGVGWDKKIFVAMPPNHVFCSISNVTKLLLKNKSRTSSSPVLSLKYQSSKELQHEMLHNFTQRWLVILFTVGLEAH